MDSSRFFRKLAFAVIGLGICFTMSSTASARDKSSGCGPAWYVFKDKTILSSAIRSILHATSSPATAFSMTSGTSNCSKHKLVQENQETLHFVTVNLELLRQDVAKGEGPYLSGLSATMGCDFVGRERLGSVMQSNFSQIFSGDQPMGIVDRTHGIASEDAILYQHCSSRA